MIDYTKHQIIRIQNLSDSFFEVVFQRDKLSVIPGNIIHIYKVSGDGIPIASGISEVWCRIILSRDKYGSIFSHGTKSIKINKDIKNVFPTLSTEVCPTFIITSFTVGFFFSYVSTFRDIKCNVCYLGIDETFKEWILNNHTLINIKDLYNCKNLYISGNREVFYNDIELINSAKGSYITY